MISTFVLFSWTRRRLSGLVGVLMMLAAATAHAQVVDPHMAEFNPSPDHFSQLPTGGAVVTRYDLEFFPVGGTVPFQILDIGKPAPESDGKIRVSFLPATPTAGAVYEARVAAVGPTGFGESLPSNPFTFSTACSYVLSANSFAFSSSAAGTGSVDILAGSTCAWTGVSSAPWLTVQTPTSSGNGRLSFSATGNTTSVSRTALISVAGQSIVVTQPASSAVCVSAVSPSSLSISPLGVPENRFSVTATSGCSWNATSSASWFLVGSATKVGSGTIDYLVKANTSSSPRTVTVMVGGIPVVATQAAACTLAASPLAVSVGASGGTGSVSVTGATGCGWQASSPVAWATVSPVSGAGNGSVTYSVQPNTSITSRGATLVVGGLPVTLTQAGATSTTCTYGLATTSIAVDKTKGETGLKVTTTSGCAWAAKSNVNWIVVSPTSRNGSGTVIWWRAANTTGKIRTGTMTIAGQTVTVTQNP